MRPLLALCLLLLLPPAVGASAEEAPPNLLTLPGGELLEGRIVSEQGAFVAVRVGARVYEMEREGLAYEPAAAASTDPAWTALVETLSPWLVHEDPTLREAAREGLSALGSAGAPYFRLLAAATPDLELSEALAALATQASRASR